MKQKKRKPTRTKRIDRHLVFLVLSVTALSGALGFYAGLWGGGQPGAIIAVFIGLACIILSVKDGG